MSPIMGRRGRDAPSRDALLEARDIVAVRTSGLRPGGLRCDWGKLDEADQRRAVELVREADRGTWSWTRLGKKRAGLERLIERAADAPRIFENTRSMEEIAALAAGAHQAAVRRPLSRRQENGVFQEIARCIENGWLNVADLAVLTAFIAAFVGGKPLGPRSRVERMGDETVLVLDDATMGPFFGKFDPEEQIGPRAKMNLAHLEVNEWLTIERSGKQWTVSPGRRLRLAMDGKPIRDEVRAA